MHMFNGPTKSHQKWNQRTNSCMSAWLNSFRTINASKCSSTFAIFTISVSLQPLTHTHTRAHIRLNFTIRNEWQRIISHQISVCGFGQENCQQTRHWIQFFLFFFLLTFNSFASLFLPKPRAVKKENKISARQKKEEPRISYACAVGKI